MRDNDMPTELVANIRTDNMRVYDSHGHLEALHLTTFSFWENAKNIDFLWAVVDPLIALPPAYDDMGSLHRYNGKCFIHVPTMDKSVHELVSSILAIPEEDLVLSDNFEKNFRLNVLIHEIGHGQENNTQGEQYCQHTRLSRRTHTAEYIELIAPFEKEVNADLFTAEHIKNDQMIDEVILFRALASFDKFPTTHDSSIYIEQGKKRSDFNTINAISDHHDVKASLIEAFQPYLKKYEKVETVPYRLYLAALDFQADQIQVDTKMQRLTELFIEAVEHFAPHKALELRGMVFNAPELSV